LSSLLGPIFTIFYGQQAVFLHISCLCDCSVPMSRNVTIKQHDLIRRDLFHALLDVNYE